MKLKDFKNEFRLVCTDTWGTAMDAWFECAGHMYNKGINIPLEWEYKQGLGDGRDKDSYFYPLFKKASKKQLILIGNFLYRYCQYLRYKGIDY